MVNAITRKPRTNEEDDLKQIWKTVFDDGSESGFFDYYFDQELSVVATHRDSPVAAGYLIPYGNINCSELSVPCAMIYAVATLPEYRKLGFGAAVVNGLLSSAHCLGFPAVALCPSDGGLFEYYSTHTGFRDRSYIFHIKERTLVNMPASGTVAGLVDILPHDYSLIRKSLLKDTPHIEPDTRALSYQKSLCLEYGGGLLSIDTPGGIACAVVEGQRGGELWIKELLAPDGFDNDVTAAIITAFPAVKYIIRTPLLQPVSQPGKPGVFAYPQQVKKPGLCPLNGCDNDDGIKRFGMLTGTDTLLNDLTANNTPPWFGLAFD